MGPRWLDSGPDPEESRHVLPAFRGVRLGEITVPLIDRFLVALRRSVGPSTGKRSRSVLSGVPGRAAAGSGVPGSRPWRALAAHREAGWRKVMR